jgi:hypothetical protein
MVQLHNKELYALYSSPNIIQVIKSRRLRFAGHVARMGARRRVYRSLVGKPEGRRPLGIQGVDGRIIFKWTFESLGGGGMDWINLAQNRDEWRDLVNAVMNLLLS